MRKEVISMKRIISLLGSISILFSIAACSKKATMTWQEQYDLGVRYLSEGNYQEAIIAFEAAIKIDPQQMDGYVRLAEAYIQANDFENATRVVNQGIEVCGESDAFTLLLSQIRTSELLQSGITDNMLRREELNFFGYNIDTLSFQESVEILQQRGYERNDIELDWDGKIDSFSVNTENGTEIDIMESSDRIDWAYNDYDNAKYSIGIKDISTCDTMADVFTKLGFSNGQEISACIMDILESGISTGEVFVHNYIAEEKCTISIEFGPVQRPAVFFSVAFDDKDNNEYFIFSLRFRGHNSDSPLDCLDSAILVRGDNPASTVHSENVNELDSDADISRLLRIGDQGNLVT